MVMKMQLNSALALSLAATFAMSGVFAQSEIASYGPSSSAKRAFITGNGYSKNVRVDRTFAKNFIDARNVSWKQLANEYIAKFTIEDRFAVAWFTKAGALRCVNYYGGPGNLPEMETEVVLKTYPDYHVTATLEIGMHDITAYVVTIQSCKMQKKVKVINGEVEEMETMKLASP
jgi:hypothetical protein